jgi:hypothetical protein
MEKNTRSPTVKLANCGKMEIRSSPIEGLGVFATKDISSGTILEEVPFILFPRHHNLTKGLYEFLDRSKFGSDRERYIENLRINLHFKDPEKYYFKWHPPLQLDNDCMFTVLPLGYGPIYNSSNTRNNADWKISDTTFTFRAEKDIKKDEEIKTFYGYFLGEEGSIFSCDNVFNLGLDWNGEGLEVRALRFSSQDSLVAALKNPACNKMYEMFKESSTEGVTIKCITLVRLDGTEVSKFVVPDEITMTQLYNKILEFRNNPAQIVIFFMEYVNKDGKFITEKVVWRK